MIDVVKVWLTIQGEGPFAGQPSAFVRLAGCNLQCPWCDTNYTEGRERITIEELCLRVMNCQPPNQWRMVVFTGGEPFRQNIGDATRLLLERGYRIQIETNGTIYLDDFPYYSGNTWIVCSPKTGGVASELKSNVSALKYVLDADHVDPEDGLPTSVLGTGVRPCRPWKNYEGDVYLQPAETGNPTKNQANLAAAIASCKKFGYRLSAVGAAGEVVASSRHFPTVGRKK